MNRTDKYIISFGDNEGRFDAGSKGPMDVIRFLEDDGWEFVCFPYLAVEQSRRPLLLPGYILKLLFSIKAGSEVMMIFPVHLWQITIIRLIKSILKPWYKVRGIRMIGFVLDFNSVRFYDGDPSDEMSVLKCFDKITVHSPQMEKFVRDRGYEGEVSVLGLLDYHVERKNTSVRSLSHDV